MIIYKLSKDKSTSVPGYGIIILFIATLMFMSNSISFGQDQLKKYKPIKESLTKHEVPNWYKNAKLGIFIHWGLYSVPAWAPVKGMYSNSHKNDFFKYNPYAEWYLNSMRIEGSPTQEHHFKTYGKDFNYYNFAKTFNKEIKEWNPWKWADLFKKVHARYVVLTTKHHDGFCLWPSSILNPYLSFDEQHASRDIVGELTQAVRKNGLKMGLYYSGGFDWSFKPVVIHDGNSFKEATPQTLQYANYADAQWFELIKRYHPSVLWNDITYPKKGKKLKIFAEYYNTIPDGVIDNRWNSDVYDFTTPEYAKYDKITPKKWEATRGIDYSFGYNQISTAKQMLSIDQLVDMFVDVVSKNGNLLLDVGPKADGTIPELQKVRLLGLGKWLDVNGEAIFGTHSWLIAEAKTNAGVPIRFTFKEGKLFAILLEKPKDNTIIISKVIADNGTVLKLLGNEKELKWENTSKGLSILLPDNMVEEPAYTIAFSVQPTLEMKK